MATSSEQHHHHTKIMLVLNMTPDSFSDGGRWYDDTTGVHINRVLEQIHQAIENGFNIHTDILDIGGESTRPGAQAVPADIELVRILPIVQAIHTHFPTANISVDTRKANVAKEALQAGASIINDVSGLQYDPQLAPLIAETRSKLILMHSIGTPETMQTLAQQPDCYPNGIIEAVIEFFTQQLKTAEAYHIQQDDIILDPGFGFGKTRHHNLELLNGLHRIKSEFPNFPLLVGTSRKTFLLPDTLSTHTKPQQSLAIRDSLTAASVMQTITQGKADIVRIHNIETILPVVNFAEALLSTHL